MPGAAGAPLAFVEQYDDALELPDDAWRARAAANEHGSDSAQFVAVSPEGKFVGTAGVFRERDVVDHVSAMLVGVYVAPEYRGFGAAAAVLTAAVEWARTEVRADRIRLFVLDLNERAKAFYRRQGFAASGETMRYPPDPSYLELEMAYSGDAVSALSAG